MILASASPRRRELLALLGLPFQVCKVTVDETPRPDETPEVLVARLSAVKALTAARNLPSRQESLVIAADTVVVLDRNILGKPRHAAEAIGMLQRLRGRLHLVHSAVTVLETPTLRAAIHLKTSQVWMRSYSDAEIERYVASGDALDKAGAYAIQHAGFHPVERLIGCYTGVVGLPLGALTDGLAHFGVTPKVYVANACRDWSGQPCCLEAE